MSACSFPMSRIDFIRFAASKGWTRLEVADFLGVTKDAIAGLARRNDIRFSRDGQWSKEEEQTFRSIMVSTGSYDQAEKMIGRPRSALYAKALRMGLSYRRTADNAIKPSVTLPTLSFMKSAA